MTIFSRGWKLFGFSMFALFFFATGYLFRSYSFLLFGSEKIFSDWQIGSVPPLGWVEISGNSPDDTKNFLVMKYEAKCATAEDLTLGLTLLDTGNHTYNDSLNNCSSPGRQIISSPTGGPISNIKFDDAKSRCESIHLNGTLAHLITNDEWMTIARNIEGQNENWSEGKVGLGYIYAGHNDNQPMKALPASIYDRDNYACAYTDGDYGKENPLGSCPSNILGRQPQVSGNQKRLHRLSNNGVIWDLAGNMWEYVDMNSETKQDLESIREYGWFEFPEMLKAGISTSLYNLIAPMNVSYSSGDGAGKIRINVEDEVAITNKIFRRGGDWAYTNHYAGIFTLSSWPRNSLSQSVGFRCASDPIDISQFRLANAGRVGGGAVS